MKLHPSVGKKKLMISSCFALKFLNSMLLFNVMLILGKVIFEFEWIVIFQINTLLRNKVLYLFAQQKPHKILLLRMIQILFCEAKANKVS